MSAQEAQLRARPELLKPLARLSHAMSQAVLRAGPLDGQGWHRFSIPIESVEVAVGELLKLGPGVQALGPAALVRGLREALASLQAVYAKKPARSRKS